MGGRHPNAQTPGQLDSSVGEPREGAGPASYMAGERENLYPVLDPKGQAVVWCDTKRQAERIAKLFNEHIAEIEV